MSTPATIVKDDLLAQIWSVSTTLTEEAMAAALAKSNEAGFDSNRGIVPLAESFINLGSARGILQDAIDKQKLIQLPITVQREILSNLQSISKSLQGLTGGVDEVENLTNAIELLNTSIWKYGFHNLSDEVLGYQKKLNQIKVQEVHISRALNELRPAERAAEKALAAATEIEARKAQALVAIDHITATSASIDALHEQTKSIEGKTSALYEAIHQHEKESGELTANIRVADNELQAIDGSIRKFYKEVEQYRKRINKTTDEAEQFITASQSTVEKLMTETNTTVNAEIESLRNKSASAISEQASNVEEHISATKEEFASLAESTKENLEKFQDDIGAQLQGVVKETQGSATRFVTETEEKLEAIEGEFRRRATETVELNHNKTTALLAELDTLKGKIQEQIEQATGFTLFGAFQARQNEIVKAKRLWSYAIGALVLISAGVTIWIAHEAQFYSVNNFAFYVKLSLTIPLAYAITFCTLQYGRERRLEEEYAFKSSISVSLNPYRELISTILKQDEKADLSKYTDFVIGSVNNVFTPPTDKVFDTEKKANGVTAKTFKQVAEVLGTFTSAAKK